MKKVFSYIVKNDFHYVIGMIIFLLSLIYVHSIFNEKTNECFDNQECYGITEAHIYYSGEAFRKKYGAKYNYKYYYFVNGEKYDKVITTAVKFDKTVVKVKYQKANPDHNRLVPE